jgi:tetratricopeptide (TPR) repeat protein
LNGEETVKIWEEDISLPTYLTGEPDSFPIFYNGRAYQGAQGRVYPYPLLDTLTEIREMKSYRAVYLENKYIKLCVLPEMGGKLFSALDKTNGYDLIYRQSVIKPALIGMLGAWTSGGIEWDFPHHHRPTAFMPVDHTTTENPDGSKTIWIGELELRHRMNWVIGITLYPDRSYIEATVQLINRTPVVHSFLYWANVAAHANEHYQVIFPPDTQYATYHGKNQFTHWPLSREFYHRVDYSKGVDISWWKNHPASTSFFAWQSEGDFLAGYDHGKEAGLLHWADHHTVPGKKLWNWGTGEKGKMWEKILTEKDGPYIELMVGAYSDNQPDYSWIHPYETKTVKQYWYPLQKIGGVRAANTEAALNFEFPDKDKARIGINLTQFRKDVTVVLLSGEKVLFKHSSDIGPGNPYVREIRLPSGTSRAGLHIKVLHKEQELISYALKTLKKKPMPEPVTPPLPPEEIKTIEELYLAGSRLEQFHNPRIDPFKYYEEALNRDPFDSRTNTALGILHIKAARYQKAQECLKRAVKRITDNHTNPRTGKAYYYLGVVLREMEKNTEAEKAFARATWDHAWRSAGTTQLAELCCIKKDFSGAWNYLSGPLPSTEKSAKKAFLKTTILRKTGELTEAGTLAQKSLRANPLDFWAQNELHLISLEQNEPDRAKEVLRQLEKLMRGSVQSYLELALDYSNAGFYDEAVDVLQRYMKFGEPHPLPFYYLGYFLIKNGHKEKGLELYQKAASLSSDYCFPFRSETIKILEDALKINPKDSKTAYYLGNSLFEDQPEKALSYWEKSHEINPSFPMVHRNLGLAYVREGKDIDKAVQSMETAVNLTKEYARLFLELDQIYELAEKKPEFRLSLLEDNHDIVIKNSDALIREISLLIQAGRYDRAIRLMETHHFHVWEGGGRIHNYHVDAHLLRGYKHFLSEDYENALSDYVKALEYPLNQEVGRPYQGGREAQIHYFIAQAYERFGDTDNADVHYQKSFSQQTPDFSELNFYNACSLKKSGSSKRAVEIFDYLIQNARDRLSEKGTSEFFIKFGSLQSPSKQKAALHYLLGLGYLGKGLTQEAKVEFQKVVEMDINHYWAAFYLKNT